MAIHPQPSNPDLDNITLSRLLHHLDTTISTTSPILRQNPYQRRKISANFEYAREILLRLEHESANIKNAQSKNHVQADLRAKREVVRTLQTRLQELEAQGNDELDEEEEDEGQTNMQDDSDESEDEHETRNPYAPAIKGVKNSVDTEMSASQEAAHNIESALRQRKQPNPGDINAVLSKVMTDQLPSDQSGLSATATTTGTSIPSTSKLTTSQAHATARAALLKHQNQDPDTSDRSSILTAHRSEQDALTSSLLSLATQLKNSATSFSTSLESEKSVLERAAQGLDKNMAGMDAAGRRMGTLRRMSEGKGWWGRMMLYAWIAGLWVVMFLVVFVGPKIRF